MTTKHLSPSAEIVHSRVSHVLAQKYMSSLVAYKLGCGYRMPRLSGLLHDRPTRGELREVFSRNAKMLSCGRLQPRWEVVEAGAKWEIKEALLRNQDLAKKLIEIRDAEEAAARAEQLAELAKQEPLPL